MIIIPVTPVIVIPGRTPCGTFLESLRPLRPGLMIDTPMAAVGMGIGVVNFVRLTVVNCVGSTCVNCVGSTGVRAAVVDIMGMRP